MNKLFSGGALMNNTAANLKKGNKKEHVGDVIFSKWQFQQIAQYGY